MARGVFVATNALPAAELNAVTSPPRCYVYNSANISCANATATEMTFDTEYFDNGGLHSTAVNTGRITIPSDGAGLYLIGAHVQWAANATGYRQLEIRQNGTAIAFSRNDNNGGADGSRTNITCIASAAVGSYFQLYATQNSGGALNATTSGSVGIHLWVTWLSVNP